MVPYKAERRIHESNRFQIPAKARVKLPALMRGMNRSDSSSRGRTSASLDASALQADLMRRLGIPSGVKTTRRRTSTGRNNTSAASQSSTRGRITDGTRGTAGEASTDAVRRGHVVSSQASASSTVACESCGAPTRRSAAGGALICEVCGYMARARPRTIPEPTLAERRGLVPQATAPRVDPAVSRDEWSAIEHSIRGRQEAYCPICLEGFKEHEVLLSCSHMFHRACLQNFEQLVRRNERSCPICRTGNYQKKITQVGSRAFEVVCARRVQALWRAYQVRKKHYIMRRDLYRGISLDCHTEINPKLRNKFYEGELSQLTTQMESTMKEQGELVDRVLTTSDRAIRESRELDSLFETIMRSRTAAAPGMGGVGDDVGSSSSRDEGKDSKVLESLRWDAVLESALKRGLGECVVCLGPLATSTRVVTLLSCSHALHEACIHSLERYAGLNDALLCCVCRTPYQRRCLDKTCTHFA